MQHTKQHEEDSETGSMESELTVGHYTRKPLRIADRPPMTTLQKVFCGLFYGQLLLQLVLCCRVMANQNVLDSADCPDNFVQEFGGMCLRPELQAALDSCVPETQEVSDPPRLASSRRLTEQAQPKSDGGLLFGLLGGAVLTCLVWFMMLAKFARPMVLSMMVANVLLMCYMFFVTSNWMLLVTAAVVVVLAYCAREKIEVAIECMRLASQALSSTPHTFLVCFAFRIGWFIYAFALAVFGVISVGNSKAVGPDCKLGPSGSASAWMLFCPLLGVLTTLFFKNCMLAVVTMSVGCWYFPDAKAELEDEACGSPALYGGKLALTTSSGTVFGSSIIMGVAESFKAQADSRCRWWMDPFACFLKVLMVFLEGTIGALTRFALIGHLFHGDGFCHMGMISEQLLRRHLPGAVVTGFLANTMMNQIAMSLSTGFGFLVWYLLDMRHNYGVFRGLSSFLSENADSVEHAQSSQLLVCMLTWTMYLGARSPIKTLVWSGLLSILANMLDLFFNGGRAVFQSYVVAQAMSAVVSIIFGYMGCVMEYATDTVFFCLAVEAECGDRADARTVKLQELVKKQLQDEGPAN